jgi:hypothetical protein
MRKRIEIQNRPELDNDADNLYADRKRQGKDYMKNLQTQRAEDRKEDDEKAKQERINKTARDVLTRLGIDHDVLNHLDD